MFACNYSPTKFLKFLIPSLTCVCSILISATDSKALDGYVVATTTAYGDKLIRIYNSDGSLRGDVPVSYDFYDAQFIAGDWLGNSQASIMAVTTDDKGKVLATVLNSAGEQVSKVKLPSEIASLHEYDYDHSGNSDLLIQEKQRDILTVYLNPGLSNSPTTTSIISPDKTDPVVYSQDSQSKIAYIKQPDPKNYLGGNSSSQKTSKTSKKKGKKGKKGKRGKNGSQGEGFVLIGNDKVNIPSDASNIFVTTQASFGSLVSYDTKSKTYIVGSDGSGRTTNLQALPKSKKSTMMTTPDSKKISGVFSIGEQDGKILHYNPLSNIYSSTNIDINAASIAPDAPTDTNQPDRSICDKYEAIYQELLDAYNKGDYQKVVELSKKLNGITLPDYCYDTPNNTNNTGDNGFNNSGINYILNFIRYSSNTGEYLGPCDEIRQAPDGSGRFLAKDSYHNNGQGTYKSVYLLPSDLYANGGAKILNPGTFKVLETLADSGVGNGSRHHFRGDVPVSARGDHILAAWTYDGVICYYVPGGRSRVD